LALPARSTSTSGFPEGSSGKPSRTIIGESTANEAQVGGDIAEHLASIWVNHYMGRELSIKARTHHVAAMILVSASPGDQHIHVGYGFVGQN
jgi:hypothetical protein